jgi:thiol-disulfide isomerase/thioredoxin
MLLMCLRRTRRLPAAGLLALLAFPSWGAREHTGTVPVGERLPDAVLEGLNGPPRRLIEFRGRPLLINVWASWCGPCRAEMASLERLAWNDERGDFAIIGISTDDDAEQARAWLGRSHATILHFIDRGLEMETLLGASRLPLTVLVSSDGRVLRKVSGARDWDSVEMRSLIASTLR